MSRHPTVRPLHPLVPRSLHCDRDVPAVVRRVPRWLALMLALLFGTLARAQDPGVTVTPKGGTVSNLGLDSTYTLPAFTIRNNATTSRTFTLSRTCSGGGYASGCTQSLPGSSTTLAAGASTTVTVTIRTTTTPGRGRVVYRAKWATDTTVRDSGYIDFATRLPSLSVTPKGTSVTNLALGAAYSQTFTLTNTSTVTAPFNVTPTCTGAGVRADVCSVSMPSLSVAPGSPRTITLSYATATAPGTGRVKVAVTWFGDATMGDSGSVSVATVRPNVAVTPDGASLGNLAGRTAATGTFTLVNSSSMAGTFNVRARCRGAAAGGSCTPGVSSVSLGAGASQTVTVPFTTTAAAGSGNVVLTALWAGDSTVRDTGAVNLRVPAAMHVAVLGDTVRTFDPLVDTGGDLTFVVSHDASALADANFYVDGCDGCDAYVDEVLQPHYFFVRTLQPNAAVTVRVHYPRGGAYGPNVVREGSPSLFVEFDDPLVGGYDSRSVRLVPLALPVIGVGPKGTSVTVAATRAGVQSFTLTNSGPSSGTFTLAAHCSGPGVANCTVSPGSVPIGAGSTATATASYTSGAYGTSGQLVLAATLPGWPTVADSAAVAVSTMTRPVAVVTPHGQAMIVAPDSAFSVPFVVRNAGTTADDFNHVPLCTGAAMNGATCTLSVTRNTLSPANAYTTTVTATATPHGYGTTGRLWVRSTPVTTGLAYADSGWIDVTTRTTAVVVTPPGQPMTFGAGVAASATFTVRNVGNTNATYRLTPACGGAATLGGCSLGQTSLSLAAGGTGSVTMRFTAGASGTTGRVQLVARSLVHPALADSGWVDVSVPQVVAVAVTPRGQSVTVARGKPTTVTLTVQNKGTAAETFSFTPNCTNAAMFGGCPSAPAPVTIPAQGTATATIAFTPASSGASGRIALVARAASQPTITDSGWVDVSTPLSALAVALGGGYTSPIVMDAGFWVSPVLFVTNTGSVTTQYVGEFALRGALSPRSDPTPQYLTLAPGETLYAWWELQSGPPGTTGSAVMTASAVNEPAVRDSIVLDVVSKSTFAPVAVTPDGGTVDPTASSVMFVVRNPGTTNGYYNFEPYCTWGGVPIPCQVPGPTAGNVVAGSYIGVLVTYAPGAATSVGRIRLKATNPSGGAVDSGWVVTSAGATVALSPHSGSRANLVAGQPASVAFTVSNAGTAGGSYAMTVSCTWNGIALPCSASPAIGSIGAGGTLPVSVSLTPRSIGNTGTISLTATLTNGGPPASDVAQLNLSLGGTIGSQQLAVSVRALNPGTSIARDQCLTIAAGDAAAYECGALRLVHALPTTTTFGTARTPTLIYNSAHATASAIIAADVTLDGTIAPDAVLATIKMSGHPDVPRTFSWVGAGQGAMTRRIAVPLDAATLGLSSDAAQPAYLLPYTLEVKAMSGSTSLATASVVDTMVLVDRRQSVFGAGWWLDGLEQIVDVAPDSTRKLWLGGDGSTRLYTQSPGTAYWIVTPTLDHPDTLERTPSTPTLWRRHLRNGGFVEFDNVGRHIATENRLKRRTTFQYDTDYSRAVATITIPGVLGPTPSTYSFTYRRPDGSGTSFALASVTAPPNGFTPRIVTLTHPTTTFGLTRITDPDTRAVAFVYDASGRATRRINRLGDSTIFGYDAAGLLGADSVVMRSASGAVTKDSSLITTFCAAESASLTACSNGPQSPAAVRTVVDGPRFDVVDLMQLFVNRWGAPDTVVNAIGEMTRIQRGDARFPMLATTLVRPNGFETQMAYTDRGLPDAVTDVDPRNDGQNAITRYQWDGKWNAVVQSTSPAGLIASVGYDAATGNRLWQQPGPGSVVSPRRVVYCYATADSIYGLLTSVTLPVVSGRAPTDSVYYDRTGNVRRTRAASGLVVRNDRDAVGRVLSEYTRLQGGSDRTRQLTYDVSDNATDETLLGPAVSTPAGTVPASILLIHSDFDEEGRLTQQSRASSPDVGAVGTIVTRWSYDAAGRRVTEVAPDGAIDSTYYDRAGNAVRVRSRRQAEFGGTYVTMQYDALNRLLRRALPAVSYAPRRDSVPGRLEPFYPRCPTSGLCSAVQDSVTNLVIRADQQDFTYTALGAIETANNRDARVTRLYYNNGQLRSETLAVRETLTDSMGHSYLTSYGYDVDGRRKTVTYPAQLSPGGVAIAARFDYDVGTPQATGELLTVWDVQNNPYRYTYTNRGDVDTFALPGSITQAFTYDSAGRMASDRLLNNTPVGQSRFTALLLRDATFTFDVTDQLTEMRNLQGLQDYLGNSYSGLGQLTRTQYNVRAPRTTGTALANSLDTFRYDALGNVVQKDRGTLGMSRWTLAMGGAQRDNSTETYTYQTPGKPATGRLQSAQVAPLAGAVKSEKFDYDAAGNEVFQAYVEGGYSVNGRRDRASYYGADGKLYASDARTAGGHTDNLNLSYTATFEEYRYDALGRRVWVRARRTCRNQNMPLLLQDAFVPANGECQLSFVRRTVWDGNQELGEIQMPGGDNASAVIMENDVSTVPKQPRLDFYDAFNDPNEFYGRVAYTFGLDLDRPIGVTRMGYTSWYGTTTDLGTPIAWPDQTITPFWNHRGQAEGGSLANGAPTIVVTDGNSTIRPYRLDWPAGWFPYDKQFYVPTVWHGSLLADKQDKSGIAYRRNRYYDPGTGRFTQEDPIGLAGGMNLYGFAGGDPINYSDPFGLCKAGVASLKGYASGTNVTIECADGTNEVRSGGSRSWRNNNPGNLEQGPFSKRHGSLGGAGGADNKRFAVFADLEDGQAARGALLGGPTYADRTIASGISYYAPASDGNNVKAYVAAVLKETGFSSDTRLGDLTAGQMNSLLTAMRHHEGFAAGAVEYKQRSP